MDVYTHVRNAFYSGEHSFTGDRQIAKDISFLIKEGYLRLQLFPIASRQEHLTVALDELKNFLDFWESEKRAELLKKLGR